MKKLSPAVKPGSKVTVYVRHSPKCPYKKQRFVSTTCHCPLWLQWQQPNGETWKESAKTREWNEAFDRARIIESGKVPADTTNANSGKLLRSIKDAAIDYHDTGLRAGRFGKGRANKVRVLLFERRRKKAGKAAMTPMAEHFAARNITTMRDLTNDLLKEWWNTWKLKQASDGGPSTSLKTHTGAVNTFLQWAHAEGYTTTNLSLPTVKVSSKTKREEQKEPFTPQEMNQVLTTIDKMPRWDAAKKQQVRGLVYLQRWSGLRIQDAVTLAQENIDEKGRILLYQEKTGDEVRVTLPPDIATYLRKMPNSNPQYVLWDGSITRLSVKNNFERALRSLFKKAGIVNGTSHRFRHTFAVEHLLAGTSLEQVSKLLGHKKLSTTERYYAKWTKDRQAQLEARERASWESQQQRLAEAATAKAVTAVQ